MPCPLTTKSKLKPVLCGHRIEEFPYPAPSRSMFHATQPVQAKKLHNLFNIDKDNYCPCTQFIYALSVDNS